MPNFLQDYYWVNSLQELEEKKAAEQPVAPSNTENNFYSKEDFNAEIQRGMEATWKSYDEIFDELYDYYEEQWVVIWEEQPVEDVENIETQEEIVAVPNLATREEIWKYNITKWIKSWLTTLWKWAYNVALWTGEKIQELTWGAVAQTPEILWNVAGFAIGKPVDTLLEKLEIEAPSLEEQFQTDADKAKKKILELWTFTWEETWFTKTWWFWAEIGAFFIPWWQAKLVSKFPQSADKIIKIAEKLDNIAQKTPKVYNVLKSAATGAWLWLKWEIITEWEATSEWATVGAITGVVWDKLIKAAQNTLWKPTVQKIQKNIDDNVQGIFKSTKWKTKTLEDLNKNVKWFKDWAETLQVRNPSFKITSTDTALKDTVNEVVKQKDNLVKEFSNKLKNIWDDVKVNTKTIYNKLEELSKNPKFKAELNIGWGKNIFDDILKWLKSSDGKFYTKNIDDFYEELKVLNRFTTKALQSNSDVAEAKIKSGIAKKYNEVLDDVLWKTKDEYRALTKQYSNIRKFEESLKERYKSELNRAWDNVASQFWDAYLDSTLLLWIATWDVIWTAKAGLWKWIKDYLHYTKTPWYKLKQLFNNYRQLVKGAEWLENQTINSVWKWVKSWIISEVEEVTQ